MTGTRTDRRGDALFRGAGEMARRMREHPWRESPLGDPASWPHSLRTIVGVCLGSRFPMIVWWGPELAVLYNDAYAPTLGATKHPWALGRPGAEVWSEIWPVIGPMLRGVLETGEATWSLDQQLFLERHGYREETYHTFSYSPIVDEHGGVRGVFTAVTETTERVLTERRVQALRDLGALAGRAGTGDGAARLVVETLAAHPDTRGAAIYAAGGGTPRLVASSFDGAEAGLAPAVEAVLAGAGPVEVDELAAAADAAGGPAGLAPPRSAVALPLRSAGLDRVTGSLVVGLNPERALDGDYRAHLGLVAEQAERQIAAAQALEDERRRAEELAELDRAKTLFFNNVSHELRTPLTLILGPVEEALAEAAKLAPEQQERAEVIHRNALRLLRLVNTLLEFSRVEADRVVATFRPTDLQALTVDLASTFRSAIERGGLELHLDCRPPAQPVYVDPDAWEKIVLNLLSNAFKFTPSGRISVTLEDVGDGVRLAVADTGTGVPEAELPRLFERFHRVRNDAARSHEGTGIGLALVAELVALHGGRASAESTLGDGTTVSVELPYGRDHLPPDRVVDEPLERGVDGALPFVEEALRWLPGLDEVDTVSADVVPTSRVLVVDDNADMRGYLARILQGRFRVEAHADGAAALEAIRRDPPDLVVSDVMMPVLDGFGLVAAIRGDVRTATLPVILVSARAGEESSVEGLDAGADDYLVKPFSARELLARVRVNLELSRLRREAARLEAMEDVRSRVITTVSHELRTPVTAIYGATKTLDRVGLLDGETQRELLGVIGTQAERLARITADILTAETLVSQTVRLSPESFDVRGTLGEVVAARRAMLPDGIDLHVRAPAGPVVVRADRARLQQVLTNLLDNAVKYSPDGGDVTVVVEPGERHVVFAVEDEGVGIPAAARERVFERFYRLDPQMTDGVGGSGLGLFICRELTEAMGGRIWVEPREPRGSRFVAVLPSG